MKILFLMGMYHPRYSANGLCCKNVVDECIAKGWDVSCVVNSFNGNKNEYELGGAKIYPIKPRLSYRISEWCEIHPNSKLNKGLRVCATIINKVQLGLRAYFWPYISPAYTRAFYRKAKALHKKEKFDVVVAAYTPIDSLYAGYKLKLDFPNVKFVAYYLDALAGGWGPMKWSKDKREKKLCYWENRIAEKADALISMESSRHYHKESPISQKFSAKRFFLDVPMMLSPIYSNEANEKKFALFAGNISYPRRNPIPLLEIFTEICNELDMELVFVGACNNETIFKPYIKETNGKIRLLGQKSHEQTLELEKNATFLVNIGSENPYTIPCKIFEYMRFRKPIISTYSIDNEPSLQYLKKYGYAHFVDERKEVSLSSAELKSFIMGVDNMHIPEDFCQQMFYNNTPRAFVEIVKKIAEDNE